MTLEEIKESYEELGNIMHNLGMRYNAIVTARGALYRLIPQKPIKYKDIWLCPICDDKNLADDDITDCEYCPNCGQALDWEVLE